MQICVEKETYRIEQELLDSKYTLHGGNYYKDVDISHLGVEIKRLKALGVPEVRIKDIQTWIL